MKIACAAPCNTPDKGQFALWQGGMEPNIPVGSEAGVASGMKRAIAGAEREQREGASGKWVAHWKMVHIVRPVWEKAGEANQIGRSFPPLTYTDHDADGLTQLEPAPRTVRGARDLLSVALQYGNAFGQGMQAAALKPADFFGNDDVLYLMEDMATGEIRLSILWEWLHKRATLTADDDEIGVKAGDPFTRTCASGCLPRNTRSCEGGQPRRSRRLEKDDAADCAGDCRTYVMDDTKLPWYIDLLNINLGNHDLDEAKRRIPAPVRHVSQGRNAHHSKPRLLSYYSPHVRVAVAVSAAMSDLAAARARATSPLASISGFDARMASSIDWPSVITRCFNRMNGT